MASFGSVDSMDHYYNNYAHIQRIIVGFDRNWGDGIEQEVILALVEMVVSLFTLLWSHGQGEGEVNHSFL